MSVVTRIRSPCILYENNFVFRQGEQFESVVMAAAYAKDGTDTNLSKAQRPLTLPTFLLPSSSAILLPVPRTRRNWQRCRLNVMKFCRVLVRVFVHACFLCRSPLSAVQLPERDKAVEHRKLRETIEGETTARMLAERVLAVPKPMLSVSPKIPFERPASAETRFDAANRTEEVEAQLALLEANKLELEERSLHAVRLQAECDVQATELKATRACLKQKDEQIMSLDEALQTAKEEKRAADAACADKVAGLEAKLAAAEGKTTAIEAQLATSQEQEGIRISMLEEEVRGVKEASSKREAAVLAELEGVRASQQSKMKEAEAQLALLEANKLELEERSLHAADARAEVMRLQAERDALHADMKIRLSSAETELLRLRAVVDDHERAKAKVRGAIRNCCRFG